jgi:hypothetical protein
MAEKPIKLQPHELASIAALRKKYHVETVRPSGVKYAKNPDIFTNNQLWEIKSPYGKSRKNTIERQLRYAKKQSLNIIIDTCRTPLPDKFIESTIKKLLKFNAYKHISHLKIIDKTKKIIDIK